MSSLDIVKLIERSPITRLHKDYENKFIVKIKNTFTDTQQQLFVASFYSFLNYNSKTDFVICITVYGTAEKLVYRNGAKPGDKIYTTGYLGDSAAGLNILLNDLKLNDEITGYLINAHNHPEPKVLEGKFLAESGLISSMIDLSDGLASDLSHICTQSGTGAVIYEEKIPVSKEFTKLLELTAPENFHYSYTGGEDYQLLFTIPEKDFTAVKNGYFEKFGTEIFEIGEIVTGERITIVLRNGEKKLLTRSGYDHFKQK